MARFIGAGGDMMRSVYDPDLDGIIAPAQLGTGFGYSLGNSVIHANDAPRQHSGPGFVILKEMRIDMILKEPLDPVRFTCTVSQTGTGLASIRLSRNGVDVTTPSHGSFIADVACRNGDWIQVVADGAPTGTTALSVSNFRLLGDTTVGRIASIAAVGHAGRMGAATPAGVPAITVVTNTVV